MSSRNLTVEESQNLRRKRLLRLHFARLHFGRQRKKFKCVQSAIGILRGKPDGIDLVRDTVRIGNSALLDVLVH